MNNTYDDLGRLKKNSRNGLPGLSDTYSYNVRSWIIGISGTQHVEDLTYNYNGNIASMQWTLDSKTRKYTYAYDPLSRLSSASYIAPGSNASEKYGTTYLYDKHGNITSLQRYGKTSSSAYGLVDNLAMTYTGNQLMNVTDAAATVSLPESNDFKKGSTANPGYTYDKNGNLTKDLNKNITNLSYNSLHLPQELTIDGVKHTYTYAADGRKLKVVQGSTNRDYVGNIIYENGSLKRILIEGGYIEGGTYYYYFNDHLGNVRAVASAGGNTVQINHYYPFGLPMAETTDGKQNEQPYKYNGKEFERKNGLNWMDYGARHYDAALGRFTTMDPLAEKYYGVSPYAYCGNNPIRFIDPTGTNWWDKVKGFSAAVIDNATGGLVDFRSMASRNVDDVSDFNTGLTVGDATSIALSSLEIGAGGGMIDSGAATAVVGLAAEGPTLGTSTVVVAAGGAEVIVGVALTTHGTMMMSNAGKNLTEKKGHIEKSSTGTDIKAQKGTLSGTKKALKEVHEYVGGSLPKGEPGKNGSPQRGNSKKGYRLDPGHPNRAADSQESGPHINWWDYTKGKKGAGGKWGAVPIE